MCDGTKVAIKSLRVCDGPEADSQRKKILKVSLTMGTAYEILY